MPGLIAPSFSTGCLATQGISRHMSATEYPLSQSTFHQTDGITWVACVENPADCASRGLFPSELLEYQLWWKGPPLAQITTVRVAQSTLPPPGPSDEERDTCLLTNVQPKPTHHFFELLHWIQTCDHVDVSVHQQLSCSLKKPSQSDPKYYPCLSVQELVAAENYWISTSQEDHFKEEVCSFASNNLLPYKSCLLSLHPFLGSSGILWVSSREQNSKLSYILEFTPCNLSRKHPVTKLIIDTEH